MDNQLLINELNAIRERVDRLLHEVVAHQPRPLPSFRKGGDAVGTCFQRGLCASYKDLVAVLGEPEESDGYKVSSEWTLTREGGGCVTIYDYKCTNLYDDDLPSVEEFRAYESHEWHIDASNRTDASALHSELSTAIGLLRKGG